MIISSVPPLNGNYKRRVTNISRDVTIKDVAQHCKVSAPTVSRILNERLEGFPVREETIQRVKEAAREMGYTPNPFAQSLRTKKSKFIGFSVPSLGVDLALDGNNEPEEGSMAPDFLLRGAMVYARTKGYNIVAMLRNEDEERVIPSRELLPTILEGMLYLIPSLKHTEYIDLFEQGRPILLLGRCPSNSTIPSCDIDNVSESSRLTQHLLEQGARNIAFILPRAEGLVLSIDRLNGYKEALEAAGLPFRPEYIQYVDHFAKATEPFFKQFFTDHPELDGVISGGGTIYRKINSALQAIHRRIPQDVLMAAFDDSLYCQVETPRVTALALPFFQMGYKAAQMLIDLIEGEFTEQERHAIVPCHFNVRESSVRK